MTNVDLAFLATAIVSVAVLATAIVSVAVAAYNLTRLPKLMAAPA
jgi:hypothetical protein